jgi:pyruvate,orthophosphate dikinase
MTKTVYPFGGGAQDDDPRSRDKTVVGGKGANLAEMAGIGLPVPPGFTITTEECLAYNCRRKTLGPELKAEVRHGIAHIEQATGCRFGVPGSGVPLLVSVRSGARVSMPGMMDTVLNLGLDERDRRGLAETSGDARFAWDSYRRFIQMYADVVLGLDHGCSRKRSRSPRKIAAYCSTPS